MAALSQLASTLDLIGCDEPIHRETLAVVLHEQRPMLSNEQGDALREMLERLGLSEAAPPETGTSLHKKRKRREPTPVQESSPEPQSEASPPSELPELPELTAPDDGRSRMPREQIIELLRANPDGLTCGQISHSVRISYQGVYQNLNNGTGPEHFVKVGTLYRLKN